MNKISLPVIGMACAACAVSVQSMLETAEGVVSASVNYGNRTVRLEYDENKVSLENLKSLSQQIGYDLMIDDDDRAEKIQALESKRYSSLLRKFWVAILFSLPVFVVSMFFHHGFPYQDFLLLALTIPVIIYSGSEFYLNAFKQARHGIFTMDSLVATGTASAFLLSLTNTLAPTLLELENLPAQVYYESAVVIISFILLGRILEERARKSASSAIRKLSGLQPKKIQIERDGETFDLSPALVVPGDIFRLKPGETIAVDGIILSGLSSVDESSITGEPFPVSKSSGNTVYSGTLNLEGILEIEATKAGNETVLARIIALVDEAISTKPPIQKLVDKIAAVFVPTVFGISLLTFIGWIIAGQTMGFAFITSISVLIIACPCALGLATPTALIAGIGRGAKEGILVRNAAVLESAATIDTVLFDKTGTLTTGKPIVQKLEWFNNPGIQDKQAVFELERESTHPLAKAILSVEGNNLSDNIQLSDFKEEAGKGISARIGNDLWLAGNLKLLTDNGFDLRVLEIESNPELNNLSIVFVAKNNSLIAKIYLSDQIREESAKCISELQKMGMKVAMLTGDQTGSANYIAGSLGLNRVFSQLLPEGKGEIVEQYQKEKCRVAMVGDGINDAYALAKADLGIAMGNGTDIAIGSADIVLMKAEILNIIKALELSRATVKIIRQNLFWAFFYNLLAIPVASGIFYTFTGYLLDPMLAGAAMAISSLTVVGNSLRLNFKKFNNSK
ncbi:MAG: copper-translocating P-type ATPase [Bacteroidales bacterium]|nr:copper-translocating P-type ATPase [Bacteroidales bacterium]